MTELPLQSEEDEQTKAERVILESTENVIKENKQPYRRGINHNAKGILAKVYHALDKGVKEKKGKFEEVKILETHNRLRVRKQLLLIRKFLRMDTKNITVDDERSTYFKDYE